MNVFLAPLDRSNNEEQNVYLASILPKFGRTCFLLQIINPIYLYLSCIMQKSYIFLHNNTTFSFFFFMGKHCFHILHAPGTRVNDMMYLNQWFPAFSRRDLEHFWHHYVASPKKCSTPYFVKWENVFSKYNYFKVLLILFIQKTNY